MPQAVAENAPRRSVLSARLRFSEPGQRLHGQAEIPGLPGVGDLGQMAEGPVVFTKLGPTPGVGFANKRRNWTATGMSCNSFQAGFV